MDVHIPSKPTTATPHPGATLSNTLVPVNVITTSGRNSSDHNIPPQYLPPNTRKRIVGILPTDSSRYDRDIIIPANRNKWVVDPLFTDYNHLPSPAGWEYYIQAEGQLYFASSHMTIRFVTEEYLFTDGIRDEVEEFIRILESALLSVGEEGWTDTEVFVETSEEEWQYYIVSHPNRCVVWLDQQDISWLSDEICGVECLAHFRYLMDNQYYTHLERFPHMRTLPDGLLDELSGIITHECIDAVTSLESTAAYTPGELKYLADLVNELQRIHMNGKVDSYVITSAARLMSIFSLERAFFFYGVHGAKLGSTQFNRGIVQTKTWLINTLSPLLFFAPDTHIHSLMSMWADKTIRTVPWKAFIGQLEREWEQFILYSTVLLNANVAFLAVPFVYSNDNTPTTVITNSTGTYVQSSNLPGDRPLSAPGIASQLSIVASLASIIIGLLLLRRHRGKKKDSAFDAARYILKREHPRLGLETLAILFSLPFAMLMWSMVAFILAIGISCFQVNGILSPTVFTIAWAVVFVLILWTVITGWETKSEHSWREYTPWSLFSYFQKNRKDNSDNIELDHKKRHKGIVWLRRCGFVQLPRVISRRKKRGEETQGGLQLTQVPSRRSATAPGLPMHHHD